MHRRARVAAPRAQVQHRDQAADARRDVHDRAPGEVDCPQLEQEALRARSRRPHPVAQRAVDQQAPERDEDAVAAEPHALGEGARDERRGDDRELALEHREHQVRDAVAADGPVDAVEEHEARVPADPAAQDVRPESQRKPHRDPQHADDRHRGEAVHHRAQDVLRPDEAAVEHRQAGHHEQHQRRGGEHPRRGARVDRGLLRHCRGRRVRHADADGNDQEEHQGRSRHDGAYRVALDGKHPCLLRSQLLAAGPGTTRPVDLGARTQLPPGWRPTGTWSGIAGCHNPAHGGTAALRFGVAPVPALSGRRRRVAGGGAGPTW